MECLNKLVSYKKPCVTSGEAKYLVQSLPAISSDFAANVANSDQVSAANLFEESLNFNANLISERLRTLLNGMVVPNDIFSSCACVAPSDFTGVTFQSKTQAYGIQLFFNPVSKSGYFYIDTIRVLSSNTATNVVFTIEEEDGSTQTVIVDKITGNTYNTVSLAYKVKTQKVKIYATGLNFAQFSCFDVPKGCGCGGQKPVNAAKDYQTQFLNVYQYDSLTPNSYNTDGVVTAIQPCVTFKCDTDVIMCQYADRFALPLLYFTGASLLEQSLMSDRLNISTIADMETRQMVIKDYYKKGNDYLETSARAIETALRAGKGDNCIVCTGTRSGWLIG